MQPGRGDRSAAGCRTGLPFLRFHGLCPFSYSGAVETPRNPLFMDNTAVLFEEVYTFFSVLQALEATFLTLRVGEAQL